MIPVYTIGPEHLFPSIGHWTVETRFMKQTGVWFIYTEKGMLIKLILLQTARYPTNADMIVMMDFNLLRDELGQSSNNSAGMISYEKLAHCRMVCSHAEESVMLNAGDLVHFAIFLCTFRRGTEHMVR